jgi:uncharacterized protein (TIGR03437 family)
MIRGIFLLLLASVDLMFGGIQNLPALPNNAGVALSIQVDVSGNIYAIGTTLGTPTSNNGDAYVAKVSPDGKQLFWLTTLGGSSLDNGTALAVGADGSVYLTGTTQSLDFPTTPGAMQPAFGTSQGQQAFAAKLDTKGAVVYSTYIGGSAMARGQEIAVDNAGHAFATGFTDGAGFPTTAGAVGGDTASTTGFIVELDPAGSRAMVAIRGFGGNRIALDNAGNIYAVGAITSTSAPTTPGAFQSKTAGLTCQSSLFGGSSPCAYQYISKIDPTGTQVIFATYVAGQWGAVPRGLAVDADGNVIVAGLTYGADFPVTPGAYQPEYLPDPLPPILGPFTHTPPAQAGYVMKLNSSGTGLLWSSYFSGTSAVTIAAMSVDAAGNIVVGGYSSSSDLPGLWSTPVASRPPKGGQGFVARFSADGQRLSTTQVIPDIVFAVAAKSDGTTVIYDGNLAIVSFPPDGRVYGIADPADNARVVAVAPGQLLTLYGKDLAQADPAFPSIGPGGSFPTSFKGVTVTFNGLPSPILYTDARQINLQVPFEVAGQTELTMQISSQFAATPLSESYILGVVARQPSALLSTTNFEAPIFGRLSCDGTVYGGLFALAVNADGTVNSCANPAPKGSMVKIFVNGLGVTSPPLSTGAINTASPPVITPAVGSNTFQAPATLTRAAPGTISSVAEVTILVSSPGPVVTLPLGVAGARAREQGVVIWAKP